MIFLALDVALFSTLGSSGGPAVAIGLNCAKQDVRYSLNDSERLERNV